MIYQIMAVVILIIFYGIYLGKMLSQKRKGIQTDQIAKGKKELKVFIIELIMKIVTYTIVAIEILSIVLNLTAMPEIIRMIGMGICIAGDIIFGLSVWTMRDSWRAGIPDNDKTTIITGGIYGFSRNPAFLGFDLVYIGVLIMFFNWTLLIFTLFAILMLHLQILQEERYLPTVFGQEYLEYKRKVRRYL